MSSFVEITRGQTPNGEFYLTTSISDFFSDIEIGFSDKGGWFKTNIPANSNNVQITVTDTWEDVPNASLDNRITCGKVRRSRSKQ